MQKSYRILGLILMCIFFCACAKNKNNQTSEPNPSNVVEQQMSGEEEQMNEGSKQEMTYEQISMEEAKQLMADEEGYIIVDARTIEEYANGHIPDAICIPNESIGDEMPEKLPNKEQLILVYCRSGNRSKQASQKLAKLGYTNVKEFGGIMDWDGDIEQ